MHSTQVIVPLIHENLWVIVSFAIGAPAADRYIDKHFTGEWKYLRRTVRSAERKADRALLEMATQIRILDDREKLSAYFKQVGQTPFGEVLQADGKTTPLYLRDMTNKVVHAAGFKWNLDDPDKPKIECLPNDEERWKRATIEISALMAFVGMLMHDE